MQTVYKGGQEKNTGAYRVSFIPGGPQELTTAWLTAALQCGGALQSGEISAFKATVLGEGKGFVGQIARVDLTCSDENAGCPDSLIAKFPAADSQRREAMFHYGLYEREVGFYSEAACDVHFKVPRCYYSHIDLERRESVLLLEDFRHAEPIDCVSGLSVDQAIFVVKQLAQFHAAWWQSPRLTEFKWLWLFNHRFDEFQVDFVEQFDVFKDRLSHLLPPEFTALGEYLKPHYVWIGDRLSEEPTTFLHGDFHLNNLFLESGANGYELTVLDWQLCTKGCAMRDLVYFFANSLTLPVRRACEAMLINTYCQALVRHGVDFPMDACMHKYKMSLLHLCAFMIHVLVLLDFTANEEAENMQNLIVERWGGLILDHYPIDLLPGS